jgi:hypothetical protein
MKVVPFVIAAVVAIGCLDWLSGYEASLTVFYLFPVAYAGWRMGRFVGIAFALLAALTWMAADTLAGHVYTHPAFFYWNGINRFAVGVGAAIFAGALRQRVEQQRQLIFDLRGALLTLSELSDQIPVCPICHSFRDDAEYREVLSEFMNKQSDSRALGQICAECLRSREALFGRSAARRVGT